MNLNVYDQNLNRIALIDGQYVSCLWQEGYNSTGSFTLELIETPENKKKIKQDYYVGRSDRNTMMVIKSVVFDDGRIVASGKQATRILDDVVYIGTIAQGVNIDTAVRNAYNASNKYRCLEFAETNLGVKATRQISNASFLKIANTLCQDADLGLRVIRQGQTLVAEFYKPVANKNLVFSKNFGNLINPTVTFSSEAHKNYAYVFGAGEGENRAMVEIDGTGLYADRREMVIDARNIQPVEGETTEAYNNRLVAYGIEVLAGLKGSFSCKFTPYVGDFGKRFDLGDVLTVYLDDYGVQMQARITKFTQKSQNNKTTTTVEVGRIIT